MVSEHVRFVYHFLLLLFIFFPLQSSSQKVPALYIFGDSTVDGGNIPYITKEAKPKIKQLPWGIDFNKKNDPNPTGRYTNGKTIADFLAIKLGLPLIPAYLSLSEDQRKHTTTGVNYAAASAGILPSTSYRGGTLSLDMQIDYFAKTVAEDLPNTIRNPEELGSHLSESIFLVSMGTNDYGLNYLDNGNPSKLHLPLVSPDKFTNLLLNEFSSRLKRLVDLGARKFLINNLGPLGCIPLYTRNTGNCIMPLNQIFKLYSDGLPKMLSELQGNLTGTVLSSSDNVKFFNELEKNGDIDTKHMCVVDTKVCDDRDKFFFFDGVHTSEVANFKLVEGCFDKSLCIPNVVQLIDHVTK